MQPQPNPVARVDIQKFLKYKASFNGQLINSDIRRMCLAARAILEQPKLFLLYEEALEFGSGISDNLKCVAEQLPNSTIIAVTKNNDNISLYSKVILMDAGCVVVQGDPRELLADSNSNLYTYLRETDPRSLRV